MRIGYVSSDNAHEHSLEWWRRNGQDPDTSLHLVRTWAWSPWVQEMQQRLGHALHQQTPLPHWFKELAIVRVCARSFSAYELYHHLPAARGAGLDEERLAALLSLEGADASCFDDADRACLRFVDEFDAGRGIQPGVFSAAAAQFTPPQIVAMAMQAGYWGCNARLTKALLVEPEPWMESTRNPTSIDREAPLHAEPPAGVEQCGRLGIPALDRLSPKSAKWLERWPGGPTAAPALVRTWTWCEHVQAAAQREWSTLMGEHVSLSARHRALVVRRVSWLRYSPYLLDLFAPRHEAAGLDIDACAAIEGDPADGPFGDDDLSLVAFIDAWESGVGVDQEVFDAVARHFDRRQLVEAQILAGFFGTQARLATALQLPLESPDRRLAG